MKDDIKEILYNPKILMLSYGNYISLDNYIKLKDYIINLQESDNDKQLEIMKLKDKLEQQRKEYQETYKDVRIELKEKDEIITNLQEELKSANESISWWQNRFNAVSNGNKDLKSRNEKATEYMNNYIEVEDAPINERIKTEFKEVIRLLTGGDK